jgi:hypothetical protein
VLEIRREGGTKEERKREREKERFLSVQADTFAGASVEEKASACYVRNDGGGAADRFERHA